MWRVGGKVKDKQTTLLPSITTGLNFCGAVNACIVKYDDCCFMDAESQRFELLDDEAAIDLAARSFEDEVVVTTEKTEQV